MKVSKTRIRSTVDGKSHTVTLKTLRQKLCQSKDLETELVRRSVVHFELWSIRSSVLNKIGQIKSVISEKPVWADKDSMDFLFPIMSWIPYIYCYPLPWGCPCCFPPRKQHLDSCRWMMSKQAPWSWFSRCSMIASHHFLTIFSGCTGGKVFPILWKNQRCLAGWQTPPDGNGVLTGCFHWLSFFFLEAPWRFIHRRNARRWHVWQAFLRRGLHEVSKFVSIRFPYSSAWKRGNTSLSVLGIIRSCFRSFGRSSCKFHFRILPCSNIEDVWLKDPKLLCDPENIHLSFPSICPRFVCCGGRSRTPLPRHSPMPSCMFPLEMILCRFMEVWRYWDIHFIDIDIVHIVTSRCKLQVALTWAYLVQSNTQSRDVQKASPG